VKRFFQLQRIFPFLVIVLASATAFSQAISGNLTGVVTDPSGAAVNGATVDATNVGTGQKVTTTTRGSGEYILSNLPVGTYNVTATRSGFKTTTIPGVPVELNKSNTANLKWSSERVQPRWK
jgi:hypothetical protein